MCHRVHSAWAAATTAARTSASVRATLGPKQPQRVIGRERLIELSRTRLADSSDRSVDVLVSRLRRKLSTDDGAAPIKTVRGVGYMFAAEVSRL